MPTSLFFSRLRLLFARRIAAGLVMASGLTVLLGWALGYDGLKSISPGLATMKANTAASFTLAGSALWLLGEDGEEAERRRAGTRIGLGLSLALLLIAALTLAEDILGWDAGVDQLLFRDRPVPGQSGAPGRMALMTSASFVAAGAALGLYGLGGRRLAVAAQLLASAICVVATLELLGYVFSAPGLYQVLPFSTVAMHTALTFLVLGAGLVAARPRVGWVRHLVLDTPTAAMGRRLMLATALVLPLIGWLRLEGQRRGLYGTEFGLAITIAAAMLIIAILIVKTTRLGNAVHEKLERGLALQVANRTAAALAHDLNQPLSAVVSYSEAALRIHDAASPDRERLKHALHANVDQALRAGRIVRDLLQLLQIGGLAPEAVGLEAVVWNAVASVSDEGYTGIKVELSAPAGLKPVRMNRLQLERVIANLLRNSAQAMRSAATPSPTIRIRIAPADNPGLAQVTVSDNGPGLDPAVADHVFDPFFTTKADGLGVGLTICRSIVELYNGRLWTLSTKSGTAFCFTIPFFDER